MVVAALPCRADPPVIVLVTNHADARIVPLLRAELEAAGLTVITQDRGPLEISPSDLRDAARAHRAIAAFRILVSSERFEIWLADRVTGKVVLREVLVSPSGEGRVTDIEIVLRAIELLRASLLELDAPHETRGEVEAPPEILTLATDDTDASRFGVRVSGAFLYAPGGLDPGVGLVVDLRGRLYDGLGVGILGTLPVLPQSTSAPEGTADLSVWTVGAYAAYRPHAPRALLQPSIAVGASALLVDIAGRPSGPRTSTTYTSWTFAPLVTAALGLAPLRNIHFVLEATGHFPVRPTAIFFEGREVAVFGPFLLSVSLGLEALFP